MQYLTNIFLVLLFTISANPDLALSSDTFEKRRVEMVEKTFRGEG